MTPLVVDPLHLPADEVPEKAFNDGQLRCLQSLETLYISRYRDDLWDQDASTTTGFTEAIDSMLQYAPQLKTISSGQIVSGEKYPSS